MTNCDKIRNAVRRHAGQSLTGAKIISVVLSMYPGTNPTSIILSDHSGPNPRSGRSYCSCSGTNRQIFTRSGSGYVVRNVGEQMETRKTETRSRQEAIGKHGPPERFVRSADRDALVDSLRRLESSIRPSADRAWRRVVALRVIDCVLSLNRNYDSFVVPSLDQFERKTPEIRTVADLSGLIARYKSAADFVAQCLDYRDDSRSATLAKVVDWLVKVADGGDYDTQKSNLEHWAANAKPDDHFHLGIAGFGLGGFQYLRMLFGANTTKPDIHIQRYVASCVGHRVSDIQALILLEAAAVEAGVSLRDLDTTIWERLARGKR